MQVLFSFEASALGSCVCMSCLRSHCIDIPVFAFNVHAPCRCLLMLSCCIVWCCNLGGLIVSMPCYAMLFVLFVTFASISFSLIWILFVWSCLYCLVLFVLMRCEFQCWWFTRVWGAIHFKHKKPKCKSTQINTMTVGLQFVGWGLPPPHRNRTI